jgi:hypothetical protein
MKASALVVPKNTIMDFVPSWILRASARPIV